MDEKEIRTGRSIIPILDLLANHIDRFYEKHKKPPVKMVFGKRQKYAFFSEVVRRNPGEYIDIKKMAGNARFDGVPIQFVDDDDLLKLCGASPSNALSFREFQNRWTA